MTKEHSFVALNSAVVRAEISESFEEYLEIFNAFYADDIEVSSESVDNRFAILLSRTNHLSYHFGQVVLGLK